MFHGGWRKSIPIGCLCLSGTGGARLNLGPSEALHLRLICLHHWGSRCVRLGQRPEFGSSNLAVEVRARVVVPRLWGSVTGPSQGSAWGRRSTAGSAGVGRAGVRLQEGGEWLLIWTSARVGLCNSWLFFFFFGKTKTANLMTPTASLLFVGGPGSSGGLPASCSWRQTFGAGFFVLRLGLLAVGSKLQ